MVWSLIFVRIKFYGFRFLSLILCVCTCVRACVCMLCVCSVRAFCKFRVSNKYLATDMYTVMVCL